MLLPLLMQLGMFTPPPPPPSAGGSYEPTHHYWAYIDDEDEKLEEQRKKTVHATFVREAAVEAVTANYYGIKKAQDALALQKLKLIASDLEFKISAIDKTLLKMEVAKLRYLQDQEDEENLMMLM